MLPDTPCIPYLIGCRDGDVINPFDGVDSFRTSPRYGTSFGSRIGSLSGKDMIIPHTDSGAAGTNRSGLSSSSSPLRSDLSSRGVQMPVTGTSQQLFMEPDKPDFILMQRDDASLGLSLAAVFWLPLFSLVCIGLVLKAVFAQRMGKNCPC